MRQRRIHIRSSNETNNYADGNESITFWNDCNILYNYRAIDRYHRYLFQFKHNV